MTSLAAYYLKLASKNGVESQKMGQKTMKYMSAICDCDRVKYEILKNL